MFNNTDEKTETYEIKEEINFGGSGLNSNNIYYNLNIL